MRAHLASREPRRGIPAAARAGAPSREPATGLSALLELQKKAGNAAVTALLAGRRADPVAQRCGSVPPDQCPCDGEASAVQREEPDAPTPKKPPSLPFLGTACTPYSTKGEAVLVHELMQKQFLPQLTSFFGAEAGGVWQNYLDIALSNPRPRRVFDTAGGEIVGAFTREPKTAATEALLVDLAVAALRAAPRDLPPNTPVVIGLGELVPPGTVWATLNSGPNRMRFGIPVTIPGLLAGGIDPAADTRNAWGELVVTNHTDPFGGTTDVTIEPKLTFKVEDNIKFCPGNTGPRPIQPFTIPLSRLEATGALYTDVYAAKTPFWVVFDGPGKKRSLGKAFPVTAAPAPAPTPGTGPAHTTGSNVRLRSGPGTGHPVVGELAQTGTAITVLEQAEGTEIRGNKRWDRVEGGWVSDSYVEFDARP